MDGIAELTIVCTPESGREIVIAGLHNAMLTFQAFAEECDRKPEVRNLLTSVCAYGSKEDFDAALGCGKLPPTFIGVADSSTLRGHPDFSSLLRTRLQCISH